MKYFLRAIYSLSALTALTACADEFCDVATCVEGTGGAPSSSSTAQGTPSSTGASQPTSSSGGGDGGASGSSGSGDGGGGEGGSGAGGDGSGGAPPQCVPTDGVRIEDDTCAIFVNGDYSGDSEGTIAEPFSTIGDAIAAAIETNRPIYVCSAKEPYVENLELTESIEIVGGFGCGTWAWSTAGRTEWTAGADEIPLRVTDGATVSIANLNIASQNATPSTPGGSSIGILVADASIEVARCEVRAGDGSDGEDQDQEPRAIQAQSGNRGNDGCQVDDTGASVMGGQNMCGGANHRGGASGSGTNDDTFGDSGDPGLPVPPEGGAAGQAQGMATCASGGIGGDGEDATVPGTHGVGATASGALTATAFLPAAGGAATAGNHGAGGGGGGGARQCANGNFGPSGGGGGAGGCGGNPGAPGGGGGR